MIGNALQLVGDCVVVEEVEAGETDVLFEEEVAEEKAELPCNEQDEAIDVAVSLEDVAR